MSVADLRAKLDLLREFGLLERLHSIGAEVVLFPAAPPRVQLSAEEIAEREERRASGAEAAAAQRRFGAAGGMQPGQRSADQIQAAKAREAEEEAARIARQNAKVREARAQLDAKGAA